MSVIEGVRAPGYVNLAAGFMEIEAFALSSDEMIYVLFISFLFN